MLHHSTDQRASQTLLTETAHIASYQVDAWWILLVVAWYGMTELMAWYGMMELMAWHESHDD